MISLTQIVNWLSIGWLLREEIFSEDIKSKAGLDLTWQHALEKGTAR
jgi:hypothetical protein